MRYFLAVCEAKNFTRAAERCHVSQPALTAAIKKLEQELDGPLFVRERSGAKLTSLGVLVRPKFERIAARSVEVLDIAHDYRLLRNVPLRIGILHTIGPIRIATRLEAFRARAPGVELELEIGQRDALMRRLEEAELDIVIANAAQPEPDWLVRKPLYVERYVVVLPPGHGLAGQDEIRLGELGEEPYVDRLGCELRETVIAMCESRDVTLYATYRTDREAWIECLVRAGLGFAFMPEHSVVSSDTIRRPLRDPEVQREISLMRSADRPIEPAARLFWDVLAGDGE